MKHIEGSASIKFQACTSLGSQQECNQHHVCSANQDWLWPSDPVWELHEYYVVSD